MAAQEARVRSASEDPLRALAGLAKCRLATGDIDGAREVLALDFTRVVMAHGTWQRSGGTAYLERALRWLL